MAKTKYHTGLVHEDGSISQKVNGQTMDQLMRGIKHMIQNNPHAGDFYIMRRLPTSSVGPDSNVDLPPHLHIKVDGPKK